MSIESISEPTRFVPKGLVFDSLIIVLSAMIQYHKKSADSSSSEDAVKVMPKSRPPNLETRPKVKKRQPTITADPSSLNQKLVTRAPVDPFFCKYNSTVGDSSRANRMLLNLLPSAGSSCKLSLNAAFWDSSDHAMNLGANYQWSMRAKLIETRRLNLNGGIVRCSLADYTITDDAIDALQYLT